MTAQGPRKGEPSSASMRYGLRLQPALLVRGSSRRIMTMRFRPANIRVINRRVCSWAVVGPAVQNQTRSKPTSGNVFPLRRPSKIARSARTVLAKQGFASPRQRRARPCWLRAVPASNYATGGSDGNTSGSARSPGKRKGRLPSLRRKAGLTSRIKLSDALSG